jgi:hypothetical protein
MLSPFLEKTRFHFGRTNSLQVRACIEWFDLGYFDYGLFIPQITAFVTPASAGFLLLR